MRLIIILIFRLQLGQFEIHQRQSWAKNPTKVYWLDRVGHKNELFAVFWVDIYEREVLPSQNSKRVDLFFAQKF
jgi:hypothetical protein